MLGRAFFSFSILIAAISALGTDCGNGNYCDLKELCTSHQKNAGRLYGCSVNENICKDTRFSCALGSTCNVTGGVCVDSKTGSTSPLTVNGPAKALLGTKAVSICSLVANYIPSFCTCADGQDQSSTLTCAVNVLSIDTIGMDITVSPCVSPASFTMDITEADKQFNYTIANVVAGVAEEIPVPGLAIEIPIVGSAGVNVAFNATGDIAALDINIGLDACITALGFTKCGSDLTSSLPIWVIQQEIDFTEACN